MIVNTNLAAVAGVISAILMSRPTLGRMDLFAGLNGAIAGLVAITTGPDIAEPYWAIIIGIIGAVPTHLGAGIWGTLATSIAAGANLGIPLIGVLTGVFVFVLSWLLWMLLDKLMGVRVSRTVEQLGQDVGELGIEAYPEFVLMPEDFDE